MNDTNPGTEDATPAPHTHSLFILGNANGFLAPVDEDLHQAIMEKLNAGQKFVEVPFANEGAAMHFRADALISIKRLTDAAAEELLSQQNLAASAAALGIRR